MILMYVTIYFICVLISIGIFYARDPFNIYINNNFRNDYVFKCILMGIFFILIFATIALIHILTIPIKVVDYFERKKKS